jgi:hypothetical protein
MTTKPFNPATLKSLSLIPFSFRLMSRHVGLIYPMLLFSMLMDGLRPQQTFSLEWRWLGLLILFILIKLAFTCGWYGCVCAAVEDELPPPVNNSDQFIKQAPVTNTAAKTTPNLWPKTFQYFKAFFPTIGRYFGPLVLGELLLLAIQVGLLAGVLWLGVSQIGLPSALNHLPTLNTSDQLKQWLQTLPESQSLQFAQLSLLAMGSFLMVLLVQALTQFWVFFVILLQQPVLTALWRGVVFTIKHLLPLVLQFLPVFSLMACFSLLGAVNIWWISLIGMMGSTLSLLLLVIMAATFFYLRFNQARLLPLDEGQNGPVPSEKSAT